MFLANAKGSFGLFVSCSLDANRQVVLAARGQTISIAFYPRQNTILWGSEQACLPPLPALFPPLWLAPSHPSGRLNPGSPHYASRCSPPRCVSCQGEAPKPCQTWLGA